MNSDAQWFNHWQLQTNISRSRHSKIHTDVVLFTNESTCEGNVWCHSTVSPYTCMYVCMYVLTQLDRETGRKLQVNKLSQLVEVLVRCYYLQDVQQPKRLETVSNLHDIVCFDIQCTYVCT